MKTSLLNVTAKIDWLQILFYGLSVHELIQQILKLDIHYFLLGEGHVKHKEFDGCYSYGDIKLYAYRHLPIDFEGESFLILSGEACTMYEHLLNGLGENWRMFFQRLCLYEGRFKVKRLDIALDDTNEIPFFTIQQLIKKCKSGEYFSNRRKFSIAESKFLGTEMAKTLYIGQRTSDIMFRFYDKDKELALTKDQPIEEIGSWKRLEMELKREIAHSALKLLAFETKSFEEIIRGIVKEELQFFSNGNLNQLARFWQNYLGKSPPCKIQRTYEVRGLKDTERWLEKGGGLPALKAFHFLATEDALGDLKDLEAEMGTVSFPRTLSNKMVTHLVEIGREDLIEEVYRQTKKAEFSQNKQITQN